MFAVDGWKLPHVVPQKAEKKSKRKEVPSDAPEPSRVKKAKTTAAGPKSTAVAKTIKSNGKDKSKYTPYGKEKGSSGANTLPVAKERKPRPKSPTPEPPKSIIKATTGKREGGRPEKAPLARPPRSERDKTPPKLLAKEPPPTFTGLAHNKHLTPLQLKMAAKLSGARFRWINERLYTSTGSDALQLMGERPEMFEEYHAGFRSQVADWPSNPIDIYKARLEEVITSARGQKAGGKRLVVADLGCGEAMLAKRMLELDPKGKVVTVKSFDLHAANERIVAADIAALPLPAHSVDVAVFCLSLMGTDFMRFLQEAHRVLKSDGGGGGGGGGGRLWVSEIKSRFGAGDADAKTFIDALAKIGFRLTDADRSNKMFINLDFVKVKPSAAAAAAATTAPTKDHKVGMLLKPCTYKRR